MCLLLTFTAHIIAFADSSVSFMMHIGSGFFCQKELVDSVIISL